MEKEIRNSLLGGITKVGGSASLNMCDSEDHLRDGTRFVQAHLGPVSAAPKNVLVGAWFM